MNRKRIKTNLSADLIKYFQGQGMRLQEIANLTGLSESFISRVANKERSFTIDHLLKLEESTQRPLPLLLLEAISQESVPKGLLPLYQSVRGVLWSASELTYIFDGQNHRSHAKVNRLARTKNKDSSKIHAKKRQQQATHK